MQCRMIARGTRTRTSSNSMPVCTRSSAHTTDRSTLGSTRPWDGIRPYRLAGRARLPEGSRALGPQHSLGAKSSPSGPRDAKPRATRYIARGYAMARRFAMTARQWGGPSNGRLGAVMPRQSWACGLHADEYAPVPIIERRRHRLILCGVRSCHGPSGDRVRRHPEPAVRFAGPATRFVPAPQLPCPAPQNASSA